MRTTLQTQSKASSSAPATFAPVRRSLLQRKCACGGTPGPSGECEACREKKLQRRSARVSAPSSNNQPPSPVSEVPSIVHEVLRSPGQPLDTATRAFMEPRFGHDFGRVSVFRLKPTVSEEDLRANDAISERSRRSDQFGRGATHGLSIPKKGEQDIVDVFTTASRSRRRDFQVSKPELGLVNAPESSATAANSEINNINGDGGGGGPAPGGGSAQATGGSICDQPISMNKVVAGSFLGGRSMGDYYPDLAGGGYWQHGDTGGPFNTGTRVGANAQLWGDFRIPCRPDLFSLAQTVTYARAIFNGVHDPQEGVVQDDIAASGRNFSQAPTRQEFGPAGGGWAISMADPPSIGLNAGLNAEFDRDFVTTLIGPTGRRSVNWSTSIRVVNGAVTQNTIT